MTIQEWDRLLSGTAPEEYDRELCRRLRRRKFRAVAEVVGWIITLGLFAALLWLFLAATPDQYSAECETLRTELEAQGK